MVILEWNIDIKICGAESYHRVIDTFPSTVFFFVITDTYIRKFRNCENETRYNLTTSNKISNQNMYMKIVWSKNIKATFLIHRVNLIIHVNKNAQSEHTIGLVQF